VQQFVETDLLKALKYARSLEAVGQVIAIQELAHVKLATKQALLQIRASQIAETEI